MCSVQGETARMCRVDRLSEERTVSMARLIASIVTLAMLTPSLALAQWKPVGPGASCPHGDMSSGSFCVAAAPNGEGYDLNFENAPVATLAKVILGDILGVGYVIDPRVQGTVTLASGRPVPKSDILFVLESALRLSGVALVGEAGGGYRLLPGPDAIGSAALDPADKIEPGFGIT